jgi:hypothetical protein
MKIQQLHFNPLCETVETTENFDATKSQLVMVFGSIKLVSEALYFNTLKEKYPIANIVTISDCGQIIKDEVFDDSIISTALQFEQSTSKVLSFNIRHFEDSKALGKQIAQDFDKENLRLILVLADGILVNGSDLVEGLRTNLPSKIIVTGGLAGDGAAFIETKVGLNEIPKSGEVAAIAFYGDKLKIGFGSFGGFDAFGPERKVTKSIKNVVYEIDEGNALDLYKNYFGKYASELPSSALPFPLGIITENEPLVRTILGIDETQKSITFAGNINEGDTVRMMKANFSKLFDAATTSATQSLTPFNNQNPEFALLISCVGRKMVLNERVDEEIETTRHILGSKTIISGFYSYGEISPLSNKVSCELFNQTMTITTLGEDC